MKKFVEAALLCFVVLIASSCGKGKKNIVSSYEDGSPFIVEYTKNQNGKEKKVYGQHFYQNGKIRCEGKYDGEKRIGKWNFYFENGEKFAVADFSSAKEGKDWEVWQKGKNKLVDKTDNLTSIAFSNEGTPVSMKVKNNEGEVFLRFFNSFNIMERWTLKGNIPQGESKSWYEDGNVNSVHYYKDGYQDSVYIVYSPEGSTIIKGSYKMGVKVGKWEYYSSDGRPLGIEIYDTDGTKLKSRQDDGLNYIGADGKPAKQE